MGKKHRHNAHHDHTGKVTHISRSHDAPARESGPWLTVSVVLGVLLLGSLLTGGYGDWGLFTGLAPWSGGDQRSSNEFNLDGAYAMGAQDAPVTIIEYSDFQCPFCARFHSDTFPQIERDYIATGQVQYVYKHFPLSFNQNARPAANAAECAGAQGSFFDYSSILYSNQARWSGVNDPTQQFISFAEDLGLDTSTFESCLASGEHEERIQSDFDEGSQRGVRGTPAFFVNGQLISGAQPYAVFRDAIEAALAGEEPALPTPEPEPGIEVIQLSRDDVMGYALGSDDAQVIILEWSSYHCPFCGRHHTQTMPQLEENYINTGIAQLIYHDFDFQPKSKIAATAARCAAEQTDYFEYQKILYENQAEWSPLGTAETRTAFINYAEELGITTEEFAECLDSDRYSDEVAAESALGRTVGVSGTPSFLIGNFQEGFVPLVGAQPYSAFEQVIEAELA